MDFSEATALFIYLVPEGILKLKDALIAALGRGVRIVTYGMLQYSCRLSTSSQHHFLLSAVFSIPGLSPTEVHI